MTLEQTVAGPDETIRVDLADGDAIVLRRYLNPGRPRLALSHGNGFAIDAYAPFWSPLRQEFELFLFDMRHHGRNAPQDPTRTGYDLYASDLDRVFRTIRDVARGAPICGVFHSLSAIAAIVHASGGSVLPDALILFDPPVQPPPGHALYGAMHDALMKLADWSSARPARYESPEALSRQLGAARSNSGWVAGALDLMARSILRPVDGGWQLCCPPAVEARNYLDDAALNLWTSLPKAQAPIMLIGADPDHPSGQAPAPVNAALAAAFRLPYRMVPETTHMLQIERPDACRAALRDLLADFM